MKKREIFLLIILFIVIYAFIFVKFIWGGAIPDIEKVQAEIEKVKSEKAQLDEDYKNIEKLKNNLEIKNVQDERIDEYLMYDASSADSIDYLDKLIKLFEKSVTGISFENPVKKEVVSKDATSTTGTTGTTGTTSTTDTTGTASENVVSTEKKSATNTYYEFRFSFKAEMTYEESMELVNFIEGGSRKVKISKFDLFPSSSNSIKAGQSVNSGQRNNNGSNADESADESSEDLFSVEMTINMYSKNLGSINNIYNYAKNNYNRFINSEDKVIVPNLNTDLNNKKPDGVVSRNDSVSEGSSGTVATERKKSDIEMRLGSFMASGPNFIIFGSGGYRNNLLRYKTKEVTKVSVNINKETYNVEVYSPDNGTSGTIQGALSNEEPHITVISNFPTDVVENKNLGIDLMVRNESGKMVSISLTDKNNAVRITDRNGSVIRGYSQSENVKIL